MTRATIGRHIFGSPALRVAYESGMRAGIELAAKIAPVTDARYIAGQAIHIHGAGYLP